MKEKYINHCKSRLFKKNIFPANVGHLSIQIKIRVKKCHFCWRFLRFSNYYCQKKYFETNRKNF